MQRFNLFSAKKPEVIVENDEHVIIPLLPHESSKKNELKQLQKEKVSTLLGRFKHYPEAQPEAKILIALSKLIWSIEGYFEQRQDDMQKEMDHRSKQASFTSSGILGSLTTALGGAIMGGYGLVQTLPIYNQINNKISQLQAACLALACNYQNTIQTTIDQFSHTSIPGTQQLCTEVDPNPSREHYFLNPYCQSFFQTFLTNYDIFSALRETFTWIGFEPNYSCFDFRDLHGNKHYWDFPNNDNEGFCIDQDFHMRKIWWNSKYNCSDHSTSNRYSVKCCQDYLTNFCNVILPDTYFNFQDFYATPQGSSYQSQNVPAVCSSVYPMEDLYHCYEQNNGSLTSIIHPICEQIRTNYCNMTSYLFQENQTLFQNLSSQMLLKDQYTNPLVWLMTGAGIAGICATSYYGIKGYYQYRNAHADEIVLDADLYQDHVENIMEAYNELKIFLKKELRTKHIADDMNAYPITDFKDTYQLDLLLVELKKHAEHYTNILRMKSLALSNMGRALFSIEPAIMRDILEKGGFIKTKDQDKDEIGLKPRNQP